jgi:CheY-like chemotaxis protein
MVRAVLVDLREFHTAGLVGDAPLPDSRPEAPAAAPPPLAAQPRGLARGGERVLLAEDDAGLRNLCARKLDSMGFRVTACADGREALEAFLEPGAEFDLVVTDHNMPRMNGDELIRRIREAGERVPVLLYTGYLDQYTGQEVATCGADRVLQKPLPLADFQAVIQSLVDLPARARRA